VRVQVGKTTLKFRFESRIETGARDGNPNVLGRIPGRMRQLCKFVQERIQTAMNKPLKTNKTADRAS